MKKHIAYCLLLLLPFQALFAQQPKTNPNGFNVFYYPNGKKSSEGRLVNGQPEGYWKNFYVSGVLKSEGNRKNNLLDSIWKFYSEEGLLTKEIAYRNNLFNGPTKTYDREGFLKQQTNYVDNLKQGISYEYYQNGAIKTETQYVKDQPQGTAYEFDRRGEIISLITYQNGFLVRKEKINRTNSEGEKVGVWKIFYDDRTIREEGEYRTGKKHGYWRQYNPKGLLVSTVKYDMGQLVEDAEELADLDVRFQYFDDGQPRFRGTYLNGEAHGIHMWFDENGNITGTKLFKQGKLLAEGLMDEKGLRQGAWKEYYYPSGELRAEGEYKDGMRFKKWVFYFQDGTIEQAGDYAAEEKPDGDWVWYYPNGNKLREETFNKGRENGWLIEYSDSGSVMTKGEYIDGKKEGPWYMEVGDHREEGNYEYDRRQGDWKHYYLSNGELRFEGSYFDGYEEGKHVWYYDNGRKKLEGKYVSGVKEGDWKRYRSDGTILLVIEYRQGEERRVDGVKIKEPSGQGD